MQIRPFTPQDYDVITQLFNTNYADFAKDAVEFRLRDERYPPGYRCARWVAESDGCVVAFAGYRQRMELFHPRKFVMDLVVDPHRYGQGIGTTLYNAVLEAIQPFDPLSIDAWSREDMPCLVGFLQRRGFVPDMQLFKSVLDLTTFEPERWVARTAAMEHQGITLRSLEQLGVHDPGVQRDLYDLWQEIRHDLPLPPGEVHTEVSFERFIEFSIDVPSLFPKGYFVAVHTETQRYVGTSQLYHSPIPGEVRTGLTGVRCAYRRRGIAFGLKAHALTFAKRLGYDQVITDNAAVNVGMLAINHELGFVRNPPWIHYVKTFAR